MHGMLIMKMDIKKIVMNKTQPRNALPKLECNPIRQT